MLVLYALLYLIYILLLILYIGFPYNLLGAFLGVDLNLLNLPCLDCPDNTRIMT